MEEDYISISTLNDFIFCPYSIYLHNVYMESDEGLYHYKNDIFKYVQQYYRCFMNRREPEQYPQFYI